MEIRSLTEIDSIKGKRYLEKLRKRGNIVLLVGSGISMWSPSNLPSGQKVTQDIAELIAVSTLSPRAKIIDSIKYSAFEHIMERYPKPDLLKAILANSYRPTIPNNVHKTIAELLNEGIINHIITTNYDEGIENACNDICHPSRKPFEVIYETDLLRVVDSQPILFKIHGCAKPGREDSIVATLSTEGELPEWKSSLLKTLARDKVLLISGYSGLDFEISPELINLPTKKMLWNSFSNPRTDIWAMTSNAQYVVSEKKGRVLVGSMHNMFGELNQKSCDFDPPSSMPSFIGELESKLTSWELDKWRVWVFNGLSCAKDGIEVAERMYIKSGTSKKLKIDAFLAMAEANFHSGFYKKSINNYSEAIKLTWELSNFEDWVKSELGLIESYRVAGYYFRARLRIRKLSKAVKFLFSGQKLETVESQIALKRVLLQRYIFHFLKLFRLTFLALIIQKSVKNDLLLITSHSANTGKWFDLRHSQMLAMKFQIPFTDVYMGKMNTTAFRDGFQQLGYALAEMMAVRSEMIQGKIPNAAQIFPYLEKADDLGIYPEYWKIVTTLRKVFGDNIISDNIKIKEKTAWQNCQYTFPMRLLLKFLGENA